jgi:hypothetical protein
MCYHLHTKLRIVVAKRDGLETTARYKAVFAQAATTALHNIFAVERGAVA